MDQYRKICSNQWCKATFFFNENDFTIEIGVNDEEIRVEPSVCSKCKSFSSELSGGVSWDERRYDEAIYTGSQQMRYRVTNYRQ
jgi:hypothetical protein